MPHHVIPAQQRHLVLVFAGVLHGILNHRSVWNKTSKNWHSLHITQTLFTWRISLTNFSVLLLIVRFLNYYI